MYRVRLWSVRKARALEATYAVLEPMLVGILRGLKKLFGSTFDRPVIALEAGVKGFLFDCQMCGDCILSQTGMSCPMNCPKNLRNGPCGGVRKNGRCEVKPDMVCVWVAAWEGAGRMKGGSAITHIQVALDNRGRGSSSWLKRADAGRTHE
jgi:methylene-tetrahydrofolate reductase-like protein